MAINWPTAPPVSPWGSDSEVAMLNRWAVNHPDASLEDLEQLADALVLPADVAARLDERLATGEYM